MALTDSRNSGSAGKTTTVPKGYTDTRDKGVVSAWDTYQANQTKKAASQAKIDELQRQSDEFKKGTSVAGQFKKGVVDMATGVKDTVVKGAKSLVQPVTNALDLVKNTQAAEADAETRRLNQEMSSFTLGQLHQRLAKETNQTRQDAIRQQISDLNKTSSEQDVVAKAKVENNPAYSKTVGQDIATIGGAAAVPLPFLGGGVLAQTGIGALQSALSDYANRGKFDKALVVSSGEGAASGALFGGLNEKTGGIANPFLRYTTDVLANAAGQGGLAVGSEAINRKIAPEIASGADYKDIFKESAGQGAVQAGILRLLTGNHRNPTAEEISHAKLAGERIASEQAKAVANEGKPITTAQAIGRIQAQDLQTAIAHHGPETAQNGPVGFETAPTGKSTGKPVESAPQALAHDVGIHPDNAESPALGHDVVLPGEAINKFSYHAASSPDLSTEAQLNVVLGSHETRNTAALGAEADALVKSDPAKAYQLALDGKSDKSTAAAISLIKDYAQKGDAAKMAGDAVAAREAYDQMAHIAEVHAQNAIEAGRTVQANALLSSISPEGQVSRVARNIAKQGEKIVTPEKVQKSAKETAGKIEAAPTAEHGTIAGESVSRAIKATEKQLRTSGEKLAKRVEGAVKPSKKANVDNLVNELARQVKAELLPERAKGTLRSPLEIIKSVFAKTEESKAAYQEAQKILQEKYANNPKMLAALEKFSQSEFSRPNSTATTKRAVAEELRSRETDLNTIVKQSLSGQKATVEDIAHAMIEKGFSKEAADTFSKEVAGHLTDQLNARKISALEQMKKALEPKNPRAAATIQDKINKLSNLGALTERDYLDIARRQLKVPELSGEHAQAIHQLAQTIQDNPSGPVYGKARADLERVIEDATGKKPLLTGVNAETAGNVISAIGGTAKSVKAAWDNSALFRQNMKTLLVNPRIWSKNALESFKIIAKTVGGDKEALHDVRAGIYARDNVKYYDAMKLDLSKHEEQYPVNLSKLPLGFGRLYRASEAAFTGTMDLTRADLADHYIKIAENTGIDLNDKNQLRSIGKLVNSMTGRGEINLPPLVNNVFFSPKMLKGNIDVLTAHSFDKNMSPFARKQAALNLAKIIIGTASILATAKAIKPDSVETDPRSSDFGKIKIGDTRFDVTGGMSSLITLASRLVPTKSADGTYGLNSKSSTTGQVNSLTSGKFGAQTPIDVLVNFAENKTAPIASVIIDLLKGKDRAGNPVTAKGELYNLAAPFPLVTYNELKSDPNSAPILLAMIADALGISTNTYDQGQSKPGSAGIRNQVIQALTDGDIEKAQKLVDDNFVKSDRRAVMTAAEKSAAQYSDAVPTVSTDFYRAYDPARTERASVVAKAKSLAVGGKVNEANRSIDEYNQKIGDLLKPFTDKHGYGTTHIQTQIKSLHIPHVSK